MSALIAAMTARYAACRRALRRVGPRSTPVSAPPECDACPNLTPGELSRSWTDACVARVELDLVGHGSGGDAYRLRNARLSIQGPNQTLLLDSESAANGGSVSADVSAGEYSTFLQDGWCLERVDDGTRVTALLLTPNPGSFSVASGELTRLSLQFRVESEPPLPMGPSYWRRS